VISRPISASYNFDEATREVKLKIAESDPLSFERNTITLEISETTQKKGSIRLSDAASGVVLLSRDIEISILQY